MMSKFLIEMIVSWRFGYVTMSSVINCDYKNKQRNLVEVDL